MSTDAKRLRDQAIAEMLAHKSELSPGEQALLYATLAQVEATLELVAQFKQGMRLDSGGLVDMLDGFNVAAPTLAQKIEELIRRLDF